MERDLEEFREDMQEIAEIIGSLYTEQGGIRLPSHLESVAGQIGLIHKISLGLHRRKSNKKVAIAPLRPSPVERHGIKPPASSTRRPPAPPSSHRAEGREGEIGHRIEGGINRTGAILEHARFNFEIFNKAKAKGFKITLIEGGFKVLYPFYDHDQAVDIKSEEEFYKFVHDVMTWR